MTEGLASMAPQENFSKRYFMLPKSEIGYLRFILEGYDGLAFARTLDNKLALVEIAFSASRAEDVEMLFKVLMPEIGLQEAAVPEALPTL